MDKLEHLAEKTKVKQSELDKYAAKVEKVQDKLKAAKVKEKFVADNARRYDDDPEFQLKEPKPLMSAKAYSERIAVPLVSRLKDVIRSILLQFFEKTRELKMALDRAYRQVDRLNNRLEKYEKELSVLREVERDYRRLRRGLGESEADRVINEMRVREVTQKQQRRSIKRECER